MLFFFIQNQPWSENVIFMSQSFSPPFGCSFDGPGGILAAAQAPELGDIVFDASETWTVDSNQGM